MSGYYHPNTQLDMGKDKMRGFHQEQEAARFAQEARNSQPGRIKTAVNQAVHFFTPLLRKLEKPVESGRSLGEKSAQATLQKNPQT